MNSLLLHMVLHKPCRTNSKRQKCNYFGCVIMLVDLSRYSAELCHAPLRSFAVFSHTAAHPADPNFTSSTILLPRKSTANHTRCFKRCFTTQSYNSSSSSTRNATNVYLYAYRCRPSRKPGRVCLCETSIKGTTQSLKYK